MRRAFMVLALVAAAMGCATEAPTGPRLKKQVGEEDYGSIVIVICAVDSTMAANTGLPRCP